jgi:DNA polymerase I-like protein with 3'-5' exonuclease and polymerase domains
MQTYFSWINRKLGDAGEMTVKQLVSGRVRGGVGYCDGCNTLFQGLAADGAKNALYNVAKACYVDTQNPLFGCRPVNFVHDEIIIEAPRQTAHEAAIELSRIMNASMSKYIKQVPITSSPAMMDRWYKDAAGKWESGKLVPWKPES